REDLGLRTILAVGRDDATGAERPSSVDPEQMSDMPVGDLHVRRREQAEADDDESRRAKCILDEPVSVLSRDERRGARTDKGAGTSGGARNRTMAPAATQKIKPSMSPSPGERLHSREVGPYNTGGSSEPSKKAMRS